MANVNCEACNDLRTTDPYLQTRGWSDSECTSFQNDTGLVASKGHNDCEDLETMNDCLVGNMEAEIDKYESCDWKKYAHKLLPNLWTMGEGFRCAICGLWTNVHNLWDTVRSLCITKSGNTISLTSNLGTHCSVTDSDTKYELTKSGNTITLTGSDGSEDSVTDSNTTYSMTRSGHTITLTPSSGSAQSITMPDDNTTYGLSRSGHTVTLTGSDGSTDSVTIPDDNTWQANTSSQEGYVKKGGDDPLAVWATNENGAPNWRSSVTLGGNLTLGDHSSPIGATKFWGLTSQRAIANDTEMKLQADFTLDKGVWIVCCTVGYSGNSVGSRSVGLSFGNASHHKGVTVAAAPSNRVTVLAKTYIRVCETDGEEVYLDAFQDSGQQLNITTNPDTYVYAVRIR